MVANSSAETEQGSLSNGQEHHLDRTPVRVDPKRWNSRVTDGQLKCNSVDQEQQARDWSTLTLSFTSYGKGMKEKMLK